MITLELTEEEIQAFRTIYLDNALYEYIDYNDDTGEIEQNDYYKLFTKFGIILE